jgi:ribosome assembly protein YihI (activator of Der GTPase)
MIYVCKTDIEGNIKAIQATTATREVVNDLISKQSEPWMILEAEITKRLAEFYLQERKKLERKHDLDDLIERLDSMETEIYEFRRYVEDESKRAREALNDLRKGGE